MNGPFFDCDSSFSNLNFSSIHSSYGKLFMVTSLGRLFAQGVSVHGECGVYEDFVAYAREIKLVAPTGICEHGIVTSTEYEFLFSLFCFFNINYKRELGLKKRMLKSSMLAKNYRKIYHHFVNKFIVEYEILY